MADSEEDIKIRCWALSNNDIDAYHRCINLLKSTNTEKTTDSSNEASVEDIWIPSKEVSWDMRSDPQLDTSLIAKKSEFPWIALLGVGALGFGVWLATKK